MEIAAKFITIMGLGFIELWAAIPAGTALKLNPLLNGLAAGLGAILGTVLVILLGALCMHIGSFCGISVASKVFKRHS